MDDLNDDITPEGLADESQLNSPAPQGAASNESPAPEAMTLAELNALLGKDFKDKATALKSVKDTFNYVGKRKEDILAEANVINSTAQELKELKENMFYRDNPAYAPYRNAIAKMGTNPEQVVNTPEFKEIFDKAKGFDETQKLKSVLVSNPRLAQSKDHLAKAREAGSREEREAYATRAVLETLE